jgi:hypothetical protein
MPLKTSIKDHDSSNNAGGVFTLSVVKNKSRAICKCRKKWKYRLFAKGDGNLKFRSHRCRQLLGQLKKLNWLPTMATHWEKQLSLSIEMNSD